MMERLEYVRRLLGKPFLPAAAVRSDVPAELSEICSRMLALDRNRRYVRAEDVARDLEQKYLYASGFGPTNNSLQAYLEMFDANFKESTSEQMRQLPFLDGNLQRPLAKGAYTKEGMGILKEALNR